MRYFYFDTSIWLDVYEKRGKNGEVALKLIEKIIESRSIILFSHAIIIELKHLDYSLEEIRHIFRVISSENLRRVHISRETLNNAKKISAERNVPEGDVIHSILARDNYANLISRDKHFLKLKDVTKVFFPEEFI